MPKEKMVKVAANRLKTLGWIYPRGKSKVPCAPTPLAIDRYNGTLDDLKCGNLRANASRPKPFGFPRPSRTRHDENESAERGVCSFRDYRRAGFREGQRRIRA